MQTGRRRVGRAAVLAGLAMWHGGGPGAWAAPNWLAGPHEHVVATRQTPFGTLEVVDFGRTRYLRYGSDGQQVFQSVLNLDRPDELVSMYTRLMMVGAVYARQLRRIVQVGVGAGRMTRYALRTFPAAEVDAIDIDANALELGERYFGLSSDPRLRLHVADGRAWLQDSDARHDVIMLDAYDDKSVPAHLMEPSFFRLVAERLAPGGVVVQNVFLSQADDKALLASMGTAFERIDLYQVQRNGVAVGYQGKPRDPADLRVRARELDAELQPVHPFVGLLGYRTRSLRRV